MPLFSVVAQTAQLQTEKSRSLEQVVQAGKRLDTLFTENRLPILNLNPAALTVKSTYDRQRKLNVWHVSNSTHTFFECLPGDCEVVAIYRNTYTSDAPQYDSPPKPTWTADQAISKAKHWTQVFLQKFPQNLGTPKVEFKNQMNVPRYYDGYWRIRWPRVDSQGHRFDLDSLNVMLGEKQGIMSIDLRFVSAFDEIQGKSISEEEAIEASRPPAEILLHGELARPYLPPRLELGVATASMWIMNANHIFQSKTLKESVASEDSKARLAWVVVYPLISGDTSTPGHTLEIWIDAQTKEPMGGDFK